MERQVHKKKSSFYLQSICYKPRKIEYLIFQAHHVKTFFYLVLLNISNEIYSAEAFKASNKKLKRVGLSLRMQSKEHFKF